MTGVLAFSDVQDSSLELVTLATKLGGEISIGLLSDGTANLAEAEKKLSVSGVANIYVVSSDSLRNYLAGPCVDALAAIYKIASPGVMLLSSTKKGRELAGRLAARLNIGCITDALKVEVANGNVTSDRLVWGGNAIATVESKGAAIVTVPQRAYEKASGSSSPKIVNMENFHPKESSKVSVTGRKEKPKGQVNIKDAETIVSAGRGFKKKEDLAMLDDLAKELNAVVGASRPLTSDLGWMPEDRQVGLSGTTVKPKLYIAVGISGQIQHLTGMRESKVVAAINTDKNAPIFQECDYGVVGDLYSVVPELTKAIKSQLGK